MFYYHHRRLNYALNHQQLKNTNSYVLASISAFDTNNHNKPTLIPTFCTSLYQHQQLYINIYSYSANCVLVSVSSSNQSYFGPLRLLLQQQFAITHQSTSQIREINKPYSHIVPISTVAFSSNNNNNSRNNNDNVKQPPHITLSCYYPSFDYIHHFVVYCCQLSSVAAATILFNTLLSSPPNSSSSSAAVAVALKCFLFNLKQPVFNLKLLLLRYLNLFCLALLSFHLAVSTANSASHQQLSPTALVFNMKKLFRPITVAIRDKRLRLERTASGHNVEAAKKGLEEGCLRLSEAISFDQFYDIISDTLRLILDNVSEVLVFCHDAATDKLVSTGSVNHPLPTQGICRHTRDVGVRKVYRILDAADPLCQLLSLTNHFILPEGNKVVCSPIQDRHTKKSIIFLVIICNELTSDSKENLDYLEKIIASTWYRLNQLQIPSVVATTSTELDHESKQILKLCGELYDRDGERLQQKLLHFLQEQLDCQFCILFFVGEDNSIYSHVTLPSRPKYELHFPISTNSFGTAINRKCPVVLSDLTTVEREQLEKCLGTELQNMLCIPVESRSDQSHVIALFCAFNKRNGAASFDPTDEIKANNTFRYTTTVLTSTIAYQKERRLKTQTETMLNVAKNLFSKLEDMTELLKLVMLEARNLCNAERCSLFLVNENRQQLVAKVFDGGEVGEGSSSKGGGQEIRIPIDKGIAGRVAITGEILNIKDAYEHPLFFTGVDKKTGFRTRAILCFPIIDGDQVIGVAELCNKVAGSCFTTEDVEVAKAFSIYCAIAIAHSLLYQKVQQAQKKILLTNELMLYHMKNLSVDEVAALLSEERQDVSKTWPGIDTFSFNVRLTIPYGETVRCVLDMFHELGFISRFNLDMDMLVQFSLTIKQGYRDNVPYHNWWHAFSVAHFFYLICKNSSSTLVSQLSELERFVTLIACLCHDIDHRGTNNSFEINSKSTLASLYSSQGSVMERHHFAQTVAILNSGSCNIFTALPEEQFKKALDILQSNILATDLAHHFKIMGKLKEMAANGYNTDNSTHHEMLLCLIMTSCDLSDQTKDWNNLIEVAESLYEEFFNQGDLELKMGAQPNEMMDRHRAQIPEQQISFLDNVALPTFELLSTFLPETKEAYNQVELNRNRWQVVKNEVGDTPIMKAGKLDIRHLDVDQLISKQQQQDNNNSSSTVDESNNNCCDKQSASSTHNANNANHVSCVDHKKDTTECEN